MAFLSVLLLVGVFAVGPGFSALHGEKCKRDRDCASVQYECIQRFEDCKEKGCWCKPEYGGRFAVYAYGQCIEILGPSDRCRFRAAYQVCALEKACDAATDRCVPSAVGVGEVCTTDPLSSTYLPCTARADCLSSVCMCQEWYTPIGGKCYLKSFGDTCKNDMFGRASCELTTFCLGSPPTCKCLNTNYTRDTGSIDNLELTVCIHKEAVKNLPHGEACTTIENDETAKACSRDLTCSKCLAGDAPTCMKPKLGVHTSGGADGLNGGLLSLSVALFMTIRMQ